MCVTSYVDSFLMTLEVIFTGPWIFFWIYWIKWGMGHNQFVSRRSEFGAPQSWIQMRQLFPQCIPSTSPLSSMA